ncbi:MAG: hypothetical protein ABSA46_10070 [Thermodesulfovibrionales bacterium]
MKESGLSGGIIHDALICSSAIKAHAETLLALNGADIRRLLITDGLSIEER